MADLKVLKTPEKRRNDAALKIAKEVVERIESGEFDSFFSVCFYADGDHYSVITSEHDDSLRKIGMLNRLIHDLLSGS
jgi:hypothetical protein